jgi:quinol monooxygenase YgiN
MELVIIARFHAREGMEAAVTAAITEVAAPTKAEPDCKYFGAYRSARDPRLHYIVSRWTDEAAFEHHAELSHTLDFLERVHPLIDHPLDVARAMQFA